MSKLNTRWLELDGGVKLGLLPDFGGLINSLQLGRGAPREVIAGFADADAARADVQYRGIVLFPFANRIAAGKYTWLGEKYQFPINEPGLGNALHGFLYRMAPAKFEESREGDTATLTAIYDYTGDRPYYPFPAQIAMQYTLAADSLTLTSVVTNKGDRPMPLSYGWHPYFTLGAPADQLELTLPSARHILVDQHGIPTGREVPAEVSGSLAGVKLDDHFALTAQSGISEVRLWHPEQKRGLVIWQDAQQYPYIQVFIPPNRDAVAVEPMTSCIDAFNNGAGLITLPPGAAFTGRNGVRLV